MFVLLWFSRPLLYLSKFCSSDNVNALNHRGIDYLIYIEVNIGIFIQVKQFLGRLLDFH